MSRPLWTCSQFEAALSEYREGTLAAEAAAQAREHLAGCPACTALLATVAATLDQLGALPQLQPPPGLVPAILAQTLPAHRRRNPMGGGFWGALVSPRFAFGLAMSVFVVALLLNAAQINLRQVSLSQLSPSSLTTVLSRRIDRAWARGVSFYRDLRVVYEIEAALHQMQQPPAPPPAPAPGHDRSQRPAPAPGVQLAEEFAPPSPPLPFRRTP
ncbi:MAG: anti-sigma factor family protein [Terriglobales bacterium]